MKKLRNVVQTTLWVIAAACITALPSCAQQDSGERPKPAAARPYPGLFDSSDPGQPSDQTLQTVQPDNLPLSGLQNPTVGNPGLRHSYWIPGIEYTNAARSYSLDGRSNSGWQTTSYVTTDVSLVGAWANSTLSANYSGGGFFSTDEIQGQGQFQQFGMNYQIDGKRWQTLLVDEFSYLPQSSFGFGGATGLSAPGITGTLSVPLLGLQNSYTPAQSIPTVLGSRYSNSSVAQITYRLSARGSLTIAGSYGLLRFDASGALTSDSEMGNIGYDYALSPSNTIGLAYRFSAYHYPGAPQALGDHVASVEFGRKVTGKLGLKLSAGPSVTTFRIPIGGSASTISAFASAAMIYRSNRGTLDLNYLHGTSTGSGVFQGATSDQVTATLSRQLTRIWNGNVNFGYARNAQILATGPSPSFNAWFAGAGLSRSVGHLAHASLGYQAQIQLVSPALPNVNTTVHQIFLSFQWHTRPLVVR